MKTYDFFDLYARLPKKYKNRVRDFYTADDLIDGCNYMLEFIEPWAWEDYFTVPVRNITEAIQFTKETRVFNG